MTQPPGFTQADRIAENSAVINRPIPCFHCNYNLQGLRIDGRCPECGGEIRPSLAPRFLGQFPDDATALQSALKILVALLIFDTCAVSLEALGEFVFVWPWIDVASFVMDSIFQLGLLFLGWRISSIETLRNPRLLPASLVTGLIAAAVLTLLLTVFEFTNTISLSAIQFLCVGTLASVFELVAMVLLGAFLVRAAHRVPGPALAGQFQALTIGLGIAYLISLLSWLMSFVGFLKNSRNDLLLEDLVWAASIAIVGCQIWLMIVVCWLIGRTRHSVELFSAQAQS